MSTKTKTKRTDYGALLKDIEEFYEDNSLEVVAPTLDAPLHFKPLNVRQLKSFMSLQVKYESDELGVAQGLNIVEELGNILVENCLDKDVDLLNTLTTLDRDALVIQLRTHTNPEADIQIGEDESITIDLIEVVDRIKGTKFDADIMSTTKTLEYKNRTISLELQIPSLQRDIKISKIFADNMKKTIKNKGDFEKHAGDIFAQIFFIELFKYINRITFSSKGNAEQIEFSNTKLFPQNVEFLESLPTQIITQITSYVKEVKEYRDSILYYLDKDGKKVPLDVDANIFIGI